MTIREAEKTDAEELRAMMRNFYDSPALILDVSDEQISANIKALLDPSENLFGYVFETEGQIAGFSLLTECWSTEAGGKCLWIEDLYFKPDYRGMGLGTEYFCFLRERFGDRARFRLEVEHENKAACVLYTKSGFRELEYVQMTIEKEQVI